MNRFHVHLNVADLTGSIRFYTQLFATPPSVVKRDYAKWMLEDPRINFAISSTGRAPGVDHLGLQVDTADELAALGPRLNAAGAVVPEEGAVCCYAHSNKLWIEDPQGTRWETFHTFGDATTYHAADASCATAAAACPVDARATKPEVDKAASCCTPGSGCC